MPADAGTPVLIEYNEVTSLVVVKETEKNLSVAWLTSQSVKQREGDR